MTLINYFYIILISMMIINILGIVIRRFLRGYMKKNMNKNIIFDNFDYFLPFYKDTAYVYEFIKENKNKIKDYKLFLIQFIIDFFETINIIVSTILLLIFLIYIFLIYR